MKRLLMRILGFGEIRVIDRMSFDEVSIVNPPVNPNCVIYSGDWKGMGLGVGGRIVASHMEWRWNAWGLR